MICPCGSQKIYPDCCGLYILEKNTAPTAEALMRSRYSAYALGNLEYIRDTMLPPAANGFNLKNAKERAKHIQWTRLEVLKSWQDDKHKDKAYVEFIAYYMSNDMHSNLHEISEFHFVENKWFYVDGEVKLL
jgi:SEC-C motif-containing protein